MSEKKFTKKDMERIMSKDKGLFRYYKKVKLILEEFMDMEKEYYSLIAVWIIGTYFHKQFSSYPYLYFNAMKGSGKTRMLKIISNLAWNGEMVGSMTEAVLFRTAKDRTICIDELENVNSKGNENLKLLLNSAYKKGLSVKRMSKRKTKEGEEQQVEEFLVFCPLALANIWGLGNVLEDRSIPIILEKSNKNAIIKLIENFEDDMDFKTTRGGLLRLTENLKDDQGIFNNIFNKWNFYQKNIVSSVSIVSNVKDVKDVSSTHKIDDIYDIDDFTELFRSINNTNLGGRDLELFFPLFIIADMIDKKILGELLETAKKIVKIRKETDREESIDVKLYEFIAQSGYEGYVAVSRIVKDLQEYYGEEKWINSIGISRALNKRLNLVLDKSSTGKKRLIKINVEKAKEKLLMFKEPKTDTCYKCGQELKTGEFKEIDNKLTCLTCLRGLND